MKNVATILVILAGVTIAGMGIITGFWIKENWETIQTVLIGVAIVIIAFLLWSQSNNRSGGL